MTTPATRLITLILLLQRQPNQKAARLAKELGVSPRTLHRYMGMLEEMGIPVYSERGPHGGFSLVRGYKLPPLVFSPEEAAALTLGAGLVGEMWGGLYQEAARAALAKLDNVLPQDQRAEVSWAQRSLVSAGLHRADPAALSPSLALIRQAARESVQVKMKYQGGARTETTERLVDPYALVHRSGWWYFVGYCHLRRAMRTFRLDRVLDLELTGDPFDPPKDFDIHAYLEETFAEQPIVQTRLRFAPEAAHIVHANLATWESHHEDLDGSFEVTLSAPDLPWLASMVLSFSTWVTVLEPPELRDLVRDWALGVAGLYMDSGEWSGMSG